MSPEYLDTPARNAVDVEGDEASSSISRSGHNSDRPRRHPMSSTQFDNLVQWHQGYESCRSYFLSHAQHDDYVKAVAAHINIYLPFQRQSLPLDGTSASAPNSAMNQERSRSQVELEGHHIDQSQNISLVPYIRRLIATGYDEPAVLQGFFGPRWQHGIGSLHRIERRNYLFAAKSTSWMEVKQAYDDSREEAVPYLQPLRSTTEEEIKTAESKWSEWLAMQDWMLGPRAPDILDDESSPTSEDL